MKYMMHIDNPVAFSMRTQPGMSRQDKQFLLKMFYDAISDTSFSRSGVRAATK